MLIHPTEFADLVTCDHEHIAAHDFNCESVDGDKFALVIQDWYSKWLDSIPS